MERNDKVDDKFKEIEGRIKVLEGAKDYETFFESFTEAAAILKELKEESKVADGKFIKLLKENDDAFND
ncbi:MAG: hypothetical protein LBH47_02160 [Christensenellaceae bacterium]|jgi:hypothetical protein|nr:hypothetical protein [Christensenellaceae bacterium]